MPSVPADRLSDHLPPGVTMGRFLVSAYGPTLLASFGFGAVIPMLAIQALALGANTGLAAFIAALTGIGQVAGDLPAGALADRIGERRALIAACLVDAGALGTAFFVHNLWLFAAIVCLHGLTGSVFSLARQTYLTVAVPLKWRARAMSSLGGVFRVGNFLGPLAGAALIRQHSVASTFLLAGAMSLTAALVTSFMPDTPGGSPPVDEETPDAPVPPQAEDGQTDKATPTPSVTVWSILHAHRHTLLSVGWGVLALMLVRTARQVLIPLWCVAHGISPTDTNLIYAVSMAAEVLLFFPGGIIMDRVGRWWATVPTMIILGAGFAALPLAHSALAITLLSALLGVGNGLSSGIVTTLGADVSPDVGRPQFLAGWRVFSDVGTSAGPLVISLATALSGLPAAAWALAVIGWLGAWQLGRLLPHSGQLPPSQPRP